MKKVVLLCNYDNFFVFSISHLSFLDISLNANPQNDINTNNLESKKTCSEFQKQSKCTPNFHANVINLK